MRFKFAVLLACAVTASASQATVPRWNPKAPENAQMIPAFNYATVESVLNAIGARHQRSSTDPAKPAIVAIFPNGRKAALVLSSCDRGGTACKAMSIQSFWTALKAPPARTSAAIEQFNQRYAFAKAYLVPDGRPALQRYLTADYGFIRGNLAVNLLVFADQAERFAVDVLLPLEKPAK